MRAHSASSSVADHEARREKHRERDRRYIANLRAKALALVGGERPQCRASGCREEEGLDFSHLFPTEVRGRGRGMGERYRDIIRNPHCFQLLCRQHHLAYDRGEQVPMKPDRDGVPF